jgi:ribosome-associated protein
LEGGVFIEARKKAVLIARAAQAKKAERVLVLDLRGISSVCDYFVIGDATSITRIEAIVKGIREALAKRKAPLRYAEGKPESRWVVLDCGDVVVHIFHRETRNFYRLERLWGDAPLLHIEGTQRRGRGRKKKKKK